jgi:DNA-binding MarR family transcriptional regulator
VSTGTERRAEGVAAVARQTRRLGDASAAFTQGVAEGAGLAPIDVQCLAFLVEAGASPSGRLAELTGLSAGATTRMVDRLAQAGYVRRLADPIDRRHVLVELVPERAGAVAERVASLAHRLDEVSADASDERLREIAAFLERAVDVVQAETARLQEHSAGQATAGSTFAAPVAGVTLGRLVFLSAVPAMTIRGDRTLADLYRASFQGPIPRVRVRAGVVTVRYARVAWFDWRARIGDQMIDTSVHWRNDRGELVLTAAVPWAIELRGGGSRVHGDLRELDLRSFELTGGASRVELVLGRPDGVVPVRLAGSLNEVTIRRPADVPVRLRVTGATSRVEVDGQRIARSGGNLTLGSLGAASAGSGYDIDLRGSANKVVVAPDGRTA